MLTKILDWIKMIKSSTEYIDSMDNKISLEQDTKILTESSVIYLPTNISNLTVNINHDTNELVVEYMEIDKCMSKHVEHKITYLIKNDINTISAHYVGGFLVVLINSDNIIV